MSDVKILILKPDSFLEYFNDVYVNLDGDTMTDSLTLSGAPTEDLHASTKKYVDDELSGIDLSAYVEKAGDTMTGELVLAEGTTTVPPLKFQAGVDLTTPEAGVMNYFNNRFCVTNVATCRTLDRTSDVAVETVTCDGAAKPGGNSTDEVTLWTGSMPANSLVAGNMFKFHADGVVQNGGPASADEITIRVKVGGVTKATLNPNTKTLAENTMWHIDANACQRTIGASGSRAIHIHMVVGDPISSGDEVHVIGVASINTTLNMDVTVTAQWASEDASNVLKMYQAYMEYKN